MADEGKIGTARQILQDLIAPAVVRLEEKVGGLASECERLSTEIIANRDEIKQVWSELHEMGRAAARSEGRLESVKAEVVAEVKLEVLKLLPRNSAPELQD